MTPPSQIQHLSVGEGAQARSIAFIYEPAGEPCCIWLGGFKSDMHSTKASVIAQHARDNALSCLRFDYSGHGLSSGRFEDGTLSRWLEETLAVIAQVNPSRLILIGSSMGGFLALLAAKALKSKVHLKIEGLVLIAPAVDMTEELMWQKFSNAERNELEKQGFLALPSEYSPDPYIITKALIKDGRAHNLFGKPIELGIPIHILQGQQDSDVPWQHAIKLVEHLPHDEVTLTLIPDGDHRLSRQQDLQAIVNAVSMMAN